MAKYRCGFQASENWGTIVKLTSAIKKSFKYLQNQEIDLRIRMLFFLEYVVLLATIIGTIVMALLTTTVYSLIPNFILFLFCLMGLYLSHARKKYDAAAILIVVGGDYFALPYMFFTSGGNQSGMPIWFLFGLVFTCMMVRGKSRPILSFISILISCTCMVLGHYHPNLVTELAGEDAGFIDMLQSYVLVSITLTLSLMMYFISYDRQRRMLERKSNELKKTLNTDTLTGIPNRHAFYEDTAQYTESGVKENLVLVTLDINGLKKANDTEGHSAGDQLIRGAATILTESFSKYGSIYRTGGDEFMALLTCTDEEAGRLEEVLNAATIMYNEKNNSKVSIAIGVAAWNQNRELNFFGLEKMADVSMYRNKDDYYRKTGIDRRKQ